MTILLIATAPDEVQTLLPWASRIASIRGTDLQIVLTRRKKGKTRLIDVSPDDDSDESELIAATRQAIVDVPAGSDVTSVLDEIQILQLAGDDWARHLSQNLNELKPSMIVVPAPTISKDQSEAADWQTMLLTGTDCEIVLLRDDKNAFSNGIRVAVYLPDAGTHDRALQLGAELAGDSGQGTAVYREPNIGDFASSVGLRQLDNLLKASLSRSERDAFARKVIVSGSESEAIRQLDAADFDLILTEASGLKTMRRFLSAGLTADDPSTIPAFAIVRRAESFGNRLWNQADRRLRSVVPQLEREQRVNLVARIQGSSQWDFDFILLISLATLIACLGLAENSGAVIVGAMLVAPLMTPIAGIGLGVAHGNAFLTKIALRTAFRGFATAIAIGVLFGLSVQLATLPGWLDPMASEATRTAESTDAPWLFPSQMENRTRPQFYDLLIALASGIAAAYAMGRPNLFSALPGVAIAAALVPPIATSGIAFAHGEFQKGGGALLLFVTNIVIIILGASLAFRAVGIRSQKEGQSAATWPRYTLLLLVVLSIFVTVLIEFLRRST